MLQVFGLYFIHPIDIDGGYVNCTVGDQKIEYKMDKIVVDVNSKLFPHVFICLYKHVSHVREGWMGIP